MTRVIDCSFLCALFLPDEKNAQVDDFFASLSPDDILYAPQLLRFEVANVLAVSVKHGRLNNETVNEILSSVEKLGILYEPVSPFVCLHYSLAYGLSVYAAAYYALGVMHNCPLMTFDGELLKYTDKLPKV